MNMKEVKGHIDDLIVDYLTGSLPESAMSELKEWIKASPENKKYFLQQSEIWFSTMNRKLADMIRIRLLKYLKNALKEIEVVDVFLSGTILRVLL